MAELFTHVLAGFVLAVVLSWRVDWITPPLIAAAMVGAAVPDLNRMELLLPESTMEAMLGVPWSWVVFHRAGGALMVCLLITLLVPRAHMKGVFTLLVLGAASHLVIDYFLWQPSGTTDLMLWPFLDVQIDYDGFYRSTDRWPAVVSVVSTAVVVYVDRRYMNPRPSRKESSRDPGR